MLFVSKHTIWCENKIYLRVPIETVCEGICISFILKREHNKLHKIGFVSPIRFEFRSIMCIIY